MGEEPEVAKERPGFTESFERTFPFGITLFGAIGALIIGGGAALAVWFIGTFVQRFASFLSSLVRW